MKVQVPLKRRYPSNQTKERSTQGKTVNVLRVRGSVLHNTIHTEKSNKSNKMQRLTAPSNHTSNKLPRMQTRGC